MYLVSNCVRNERKIAKSFLGKFGINKLLVRSNETLVKLVTTYSLVNIFGMRKVFYQIN